MKKASLQTLAKKMKNLDFCMMVTRDGKGGFHARPMSNNGKVKYDGTSWFFSYKDSNKARQIKSNPQVSLVYQRDDMLFIECYGKATIVTQRETMEDKWLDELNRWFPKGLDTPGICLIKVSATRIQYWHKKEEGEYKS